MKNQTLDELMGKITPLPWKHNQGVLGKTGLSPDDSRSNAIYAAHAANNFPKLVEAFKDYVGRCPNCGGRGFIETTESGHGCDGTEESCSITCPVPIQIQEQCQWCDAGLTALAAANEIKE